MKEIRTELEDATVDAIKKAKKCDPKSDEYKNLTKFIEVALKGNTMIFEMEDNCGSKAEDRRIQEERNEEELKLKKWQTRATYVGFALTAISTAISIGVWRSGISDIRAIQETGAITGKDFGLLPGINKQIFFKKF